MALLLTIDETDGHWILAVLMCVGTVVLVTAAAMIRERNAKVRQREAAYLERGDAGLEERLFNAPRVTLAGTRTTTGDWVTLEGRLVAIDGKTTAPLSGRPCLWGRVEVLRLVAARRTPVYWERLGTMRFGGGFAIEDATGERATVDVTHLRPFPEVQFVVGPVPFQSLPRAGRSALARSGVAISADRDYLLVEEALCDGDAVSVLLKTDRGSEGEYRGGGGYRDAKRSMVLAGTYDRPLAISTREAYVAGRRRQHD